jgi:hypothetical protein
MTEVNGELIYEILKNIQLRLSNVEQVAIEHSNSFVAVRSHLSAIQSDSNNMYSILTRIDQRLDRMERRLELRELAEPQRPYDPQ